MKPSSNIPLPKTKQFVRYWKTQVNYYIWSPWHVFLFQDLCTDNTACNYYTFNHTDNSALFPPLTCLEFSRCSTVAYCPTCITGQPGCTDFPIPTTTTSAPSNTTELPDQTTEDAGNNTDDPNSTPDQPDQTTEDPSNTTAESEVTTDDATTENGTTDYITTEWTGFGCDRV